MSEPCFTRLVAPSGIKLGYLWMEESGFACDPKADYSDPKLEAFETYFNESLKHAQERLFFRTITNAFLAHKISDAAPYVPSVVIDSYSDLARPFEEYENRFESDCFSAIDQRFKHRYAREYFHLLTGNEPPPYLHYRPVEFEARYW